MTKLVIGHFYPDLLNLYGDRGNVLALYRRAANRGFDVEVEQISVGDKVDPSKLDICFLGGGQDSEQNIMKDDLVKNKGSLIKDMIEDGKVFLTICGGYQMLGKYYENHSGRTYLGEGIKPFMKVITGHGNNGKDGMEGVHYKNTFGTYSHGSLLPKNPEITDLLIETALKKRLGEDYQLPVLDDTMEKKARELALSYIENGKEQMI